MPQPESKPKLSFSGDALLSQPPVGPGRRTSLNNLYFLNSCDDDLGLLLPWVVGFRACGMRDAPAGIMAQTAFPSQRPLEVGRSRRSSVRYIYMLRSCDDNLEVLLSRGRGFR